MRLESGLYCGRESLMTHGAALSGVADNLANSNTPGFKSTRVEFADLLSDSIGCLYSEPIEGGSGVAAEQITADHDKQGPIETTNRPLDAAIQGQGFFILQNAANERFYSRAGNFQTDANGNLISVSGENIMGYTSASPETLVALRVDTSSVSPTPSTEVSVNGNLDSSEPAVLQVPSNPATFTDINQASTYDTGIELIDSLGAEHDIGLYFFLTNQQSRTWTCQAYVDAEDVGGTAGTPSLIGTTTFSFDTSGKQAENATTSLSLSGNWSNGAASSSATVDLSKFTGMAGSSYVSSVTNDGMRAGNVSGVEISQNGELVSLLDTGERNVIGQLALATFRSNNGLERVGSNMFRETEYSGVPSTGLANSADKGNIQNSALESSIVDPANEFINMIRFQRGYQAGSQVITTVSDLLNTTIQLA